MTSLPLTRHTRVCHLEVGLQVVGTGLAPGEGDVGDGDVTSSPARAQAVSKAKDVYLATEGTVVYFYASRNFHTTIARSRQ